MTGFMCRLQELLFPFQWAIFCHVALSTTVETLSVGAVCSFIVVSVCFVGFNISSVHLSEHWWIYVHWDCLIVRMTSFMSSIIVAILPFVVMFVGLQDCFPSGIVLDFFLC